MTIETFETLLKLRHACARAWVPAGRVTGRRQARVAVVYRDGGTVYEYRGSIQAVAERLDLIPALDVAADARRVVAEVRAAGAAVGYLASRDTVNYLLGQWTTVEPAGADEYAHDLARYTV